MNDFAISLKNISKNYYLEKPRTLKKWFNIFFSPFSRFTVINNFSLQVKKGDFVMISGPNGSGKTTLLKIIAGITTPTSGRLEVNGKIAPFIELGTGFNFELTGRENIITNATILGLEKKKIRDITPEVIKFSGLQKFIDIPMKRYSTGMVSRLAFSIVVYSALDILLLDEAFAVGDERFRMKEIEKLNELRSKKVTVLIVTNYPSIMRKIIEFDKEVIIKRNKSMPLSP